MFLYLGKNPMCPRSTLHSLGPGASWSQSSVWPASTDWLQAAGLTVVFLSSDVCPLESWAGSWPFGVQALSRSMSCGLRKSTDSTCLLIGGAMCPVSLLLDLRHPSTEAYRLFCGTRFWRVKLSTSRRAHANECSLMFRPPGSLSPGPPSSHSPRDPPKPAGRSGPVFYQITAFTLGPSMCEILCTPFKGEISISVNLEALLCSSPVGL